MNTSSMIVNRRSRLIPEEASCRSNCKCYPNAIWGIACKGELPRALFWGSNIEFSCPAASEPTPRNCRTGLAVPDGPLGDNCNDLLCIILSASFYRNMSVADMIVLGIFVSIRRYFAKPMIPGNNEAVVMFIR